MAWLNALRAELLKLKRTLALGVAIAAPLMVVGLNFLVLLKGKPPATPPAEPWLAAMRISLELWGFLMLPLLIALQTALVNQQDHQQGLLRVFFSLPVPRSRLYLARLAVILALLGLSSLVLCVGSLGTGVLLMALKPALGFGAVVPPLMQMLRMAFTPLAAGLLLVALMYALSHRFAGVALALGVGIGGTVGTMIIANSAFWGRVYPWSMAGRVMNPTSADHGFILVVSAVGFAVVTAVGCWEVERREVV